MNIQEIAHILRASKELTGEKYFVLVGSQAVVAQFPEEGKVPKGMLNSPEIDIWVRDNPHLSEIIEGALGVGSSFHTHYGYYADGVGPETAVLPESWLERAIVLEGHPSLNDAVSISPEIHDLAASKIASFRDKDISWVHEGINVGLISPDLLLKRIEDIKIQKNFSQEKRDTVIQWISGRIRDMDHDGPK